MQLQSHCLGSRLRESFRSRTRALSDKQNYRIAMPGPEVRELAEAGHVDALLVGDQASLPGGQYYTARLTIP